MRKASFAAVALALAACSKAPPPAPSASAEPPRTAAVAAPERIATKAATKADYEAIPWHKGDVDAAFALAKTGHKPLFLYWGAKWCPPCNQVKATLFNRQDFIERSRFFVPVYVDGDSPSAQRLGARFKVSGYPTMILFNADGSEITRLPGEVDADQYMRVLTIGMNGARPVKQTLAAALSSGGDAKSAKLAPEDWRMLAFYSWITDDETLLPKEKVPATLARIAKACPADQPDTATRLKLQAIAATATTKNAKPRDDQTALRQIETVLADPRLARENFDLVTYYASEITGNITLPKSNARTELGNTWDRALQRFVDDATLSTADRLGAVTARVELARLDADKAPISSDLQTLVRTQVARADRETSDAYARQSVISTAADALAEAGLIDESDKLLQAELKRSHSPYYFMLGLAANAKKRGDRAAALEWHEKAYAAADGPATRLQWGVSYVNALIELSPTDSARIEDVAAKVIGEVDAKPDTFYDRNRRGLERMGKKLAEWNKGNQHSDSLKRLAREMNKVCAQLPAKDPARATCEGVLRGRAVAA